MQKLWLWIGIVVFVLRTAPLAMSQESQNMPLSDVTMQTHLHGLCVEGSSEANLLVATHHGLFRVDVKGSARLISPVQDFMGFSPICAIQLYFLQRPSTQGRQPWFHPFG